MRRARWMATVVLVGLLGVGGPARARGLDDVDAALSRWDVAQARAKLSGAAGADAEVKRGVILVFEGHYAEAEEVLAGVLASGKLTQGSGIEEEAKHYLALARGSQRALGTATTLVSDDGSVELVVADPKDALLAPYLFSAMAEARKVLGDELGVVPDHPVRFEIFDDPTKLAMVTPLSVQNIRTTGTVGVTKYRRIMMISPRVMLFGYGWLDTAVHEYVHYLLTLRTGNRAPVWLQEGLAKLLETRWRRADPEPLEPAVAFRLRQAILRDDLVTFAEMYPSVAMLPSAERASLAYAEVETMLGLLRERKGHAGVDVLLDRVAAGDDAEAALEAAWGASFDDFMDEWKKVTKARTRGGKEGDVDVPVFKEDQEAGHDEPLGDVFSHLGGGRARQHARLGTLLHARGHKEAAAIQYEKARKADARARRDPALSRRLGRLYVELGRFAEAVPLLDIAARDKPDDANLAAAQGRARLRAGNVVGAREAFDRAIRLNPFIPSIHCDLAIAAPDASAREHEAEVCERLR